MKQEENMLEGIANSWARVFNYLSYSGKRKKTIYEELDRKFGEENWVSTHFFNGRVISREEAYLVYEEAYYQFLKQFPDARQKIVNTASEVYDIRPSNISSGLDYSKQECDATHLQDISIRRVLTRLSLEERGVEYNLKNLLTLKIFHGDHLVQIRDHTTEGYYLNPGKVPFHQPSLIPDTGQEGWWSSGSVEDWYQKAKVLLVNPDYLQLSLELTSKDYLFFSLNKDEFFRVTQADNQLPKDLRAIRGKEVRRLFSENKDYSLVLNSPIQPFSFWLKNIKKAIDSQNRSIDFKDLKW